MSEQKTHYRKAFNSPYLSSADMVEPTVLTIKCVRLEPDKTKGKAAKECFNTAYFVERELRPGEELKPMVLNATNSRTLANLTGSKFIEDWNNVPVTIYVDSAVKFGRDTVEGLRISTEKPRVQKRELTPAMAKAWGNAVDAVARDGHLKAVFERFVVSDENQDLLCKQAQDKQLHMGVK